ncbi:MAG TPA: hypothetical protein VMZ73_08165, partial [Acidimicrobiales bacterium]|nr:hypothetical protein [Acidimicrobiales bacterium]
RFFGVQPDSSLRNIDMKPCLRSLAVLAGTLVAVWLAAAGPAAAHEGTVTVPVTGTAASTPGNDAGSAAVLPGVAEYVPPPIATMSQGSAWWSSLSVLLATAGVLGAVAVAPRRRRGGATPPGRREIAGALALLFAGVAHCALAPPHWREGWHLGAFFAASGALLVGQAAVLWLRPSLAAYRSVLLSTAVMVVLYVAARQMTLPLIDHRDPYLWTDLPVKLSELLAAGVATLALLTAAPTPAPAPVVTTRLAGA